MQTTPAKVMMDRLFAVALYGIVAVGLTACGGGGGSSGGATGGGFVPRADTIEAADFRTDLTTSTLESHEEYPAYSADNHLSLIKASAAYARGATGAGETIVVVDSGIDASHTEFQGGKVRVITGIGNSCSPQDAAAGLCANANHGTAVSSIAAGHRGAVNSGDRMHGVAFGANINFIPIVLQGSTTPNNLPILRLNDYTFVPSDRRFFDDSDDYEDYIAQGEILNFSFGSPWALSEWRTLGRNCGSISETGPYACFRHIYGPSAMALAQANTDAADRSIVVIAAVTTTAITMIDSRFAIILDQRLMHPRLPQAMPCPWRSTSPAIRISITSSPSLLSVLMESYPLIPIVAA